MFFLFYGNPPNQVNKCPLAVSSKQLVTPKLNYFEVGILFFQFFIQPAEVLSSDCRPIGKMQMLYFINLYAYYYLLIMCT